jgi:hypothetical protein
VASGEISGQRLWLGELLFEADGLLSVGAGGVANYVPRSYLRRGR